MSEPTTTIFGIDLGSTYSRIAHMDYGCAKVIPNSAGELATPSVVQFAGNERIVGKEAKNNAAIYPDSTISMIRREIGGRDFIFTYENEKYTPEEISSYIVRKLVQDAELTCERKITDVVITCPAYFSVLQREATAKVAELAGLNVRGVINEPTAAAISYGISEETSQVVLVYDLGGAAFDVTLIEFKEGDIKIIYLYGDQFLGGRNWDEMVVTYLAQEWQRQMGSTEDPMESLETLEDLFLKAEAAKHVLSAREHVDVHVVHKGQIAHVILTREKFDELTSDLLERTIILTKMLLEEVKRWGYHKFDQLLLVGGSTRMPQVLSRLRREFNVDPRISDPDEAIAKGAAIYGQKLILDQEISSRITNAGESKEINLDVEQINPQLLEKIQRELENEVDLQLGTVKSFQETAVTNVTNYSFGVVIEQPQSLEQETETHKETLVSFTAYTPDQINNSTKYGLFVYAHTDIVRALVREDIVQFTEKLGGTLSEPRFGNNTANLRIGSPLTITPHCESLDFYPPTATQDWNGELNRFDFEFSLKNGNDQALINGYIEVSVFGVVIASIELKMTTDINDNKLKSYVNRLAEAKLKISTARMYQRIFVSYSRKDREIVETYRMAQLALGNDVFVDTYSIRSGEDWQAALAKGIDEAEILQLFWSENAATSPNVRDEWEYALRFKCIDNHCERFIRPVYWSNPIYPPPDELSHLNFKYVSFSSFQTQQVSTLVNLEKSEFNLESKVEFQIAFLVEKVEKLNRMIKRIVEENSKLAIEVQDLKRLLSDAIGKYTGRSVENFITKNDPIPTRISRSYKTKYDNQKQIIMRFMQSQSTEIEYSYELGNELKQINIELPLGLRAGTEIIVTLEIDENEKLTAIVSIPEQTLEYSIDVKTNEPKSSEFKSPPSTGYSMTIS